MTVRDGCAAAADADPTILYVHGGGRRGADAWPKVPREGAVFAELDCSTSARTQADTLTGIETARPLTVVAHSLGAVAAVLAVASGSLDPRRLVLVEPALYDVARGEPSIEPHIAMMSSARQRADDGDLAGFWKIVRPAMFGGPFCAERWAEEQPRARAFARLTAPWGHGITASMIEHVPTLVVTGNWNAEYEAVAARLVGHGAVHRRVEGAGHRPQDHADFTEIVGAFVAAE